MLPVGKDSNGDFLGSELWNNQSRHAKMSLLYIMDRMKHNQVVGCTILRKKPSLISSTSHGSRHSRPWNGLRKGQAMTRTTSKWTNEAFQGQIRRGGDLELQRGKMHGTDSAVLQCNFLFAGDIYRPASFSYCNLWMILIRLYTIPYMPLARSILYRLWGSFCPDELATRKAG